MKNIYCKFLRVSALLLSTAIVFNLGIVQNAKAEEISDDSSMEEKINAIKVAALEWLIDCQNDDGSWNSNQIVNDTCYSIYTLGANGYETSSGVKWLDSVKQENNNDILAHKLIADSDNASYAVQLNSSINDDGGLGIKAGYDSNPYDTVLAFEALENTKAYASSSNIDKMLGYFISSQNNDGGWSCNGVNETDKALSARISYSILKYLKDNSLDSSDLFLCVNRTVDMLADSGITDMSEDSIELTLYNCLLRNKQSNYSQISDIINEIKYVQKSNGSFYDDIYYTYLVVKYLNDVEKSVKNFHINDMTVSLNRNTAQVNTSETIIGEYSVNYSTVLNKELKLITTVYDGDNVLYSQEVPVKLDGGKTSVSSEAFIYTVNTDTEKVLKLVSVLSDGVNNLSKDVNFVYVNERPIEPKTEITDAVVTLSEHYGYAGKENFVTSGYQLLYVTNVERILTVKTIAYCGNDIISQNEQQAVLLPNKTNIENSTLNIDVKNNSAVTYKFVTEFYDDNKLIGSAEDYYYLYDKPELYDSDSDTENEKPEGITQFSVLLDNYCVYESSLTREVTATCQLLYNYIEDTDLTVKSYIMDGATELDYDEKQVHISKDDTSVNFELIKKSDLDISKEKVYVFKAEIYDSNGNFLGERCADFKVKLKPKAELKLAADIKTGADYGINLYWNDISNSETDYGYHILRSLDNGELWETRSSWNGREAVNVLNIYPTPSSQNYFKNWMNMVVDTETNQTADMGLFNIDTVYINDYNAQPDKYLKDDSGSYKYDVLFFGSSDSNGHKDLSNVSLESTREFADSGRGILFGHDTVCLVNTEYHPNFSTFADDLGIVVKSKGIFSLSNTVSVVNKGFLTSYPWSITGNMKIPYTHIWGQYSGGNQRGTVWMKIQNTTVDIDEETGAENTAYLTTNNQLGLIQTGHSNGSATADECKVLANTIFYLKQRTEFSEAVDNSFYDEEQPSLPKAEYVVDDYSENSYSVTAKFSSQDLGTTYRYRVEAIPKSEEAENIFSNTVTADAVSGIKGFIVIETNSGTSAVNDIQYDKDGLTVKNLITAENGEITYELNKIDKNEECWLHIFAVDNAGNISEEYIKQICDGNDLLYKPSTVTTSINSDKPVYSVNDTAIFNVTARADYYKTSVCGVVEIYDENSNLVDTVATGWNEQITSYNELQKKFKWEIPEIAAGKYIASVKWYDETNALIATDRSQFVVNINGNIIDKVQTDKVIYNIAENITISDSIYSNASNAYINSLKINIDIINKESNETVRKILGRTYLADKMTSVFSETIAGNDLGIGNYAAVCTVLDGEAVLSSSMTEFKVLGITEISNKYSGNISVENCSSKYKKINYNVLSNGEENDTNLVIRVSVYTSDGDLVSVIDKPADIISGGSVSFTELFNTEPLKIDSYPVVLSLISSDGRETVLDYSGFEVNVIYKYTVTFVNDDGAVIDVQSVKYGESAVAPENPSKEADAEYKYTFKGWDSDFSRVVSDITVMAVYDAEMINAEDSDSTDDSQTDIDETDSESSGDSQTDIDETDSDSTDDSQTDTDETDSESTDSNADSTDSDSADDSQTDTDETDSESTDSNADSTDSDSADDSQTDTDNGDSDSDDSIQTDTEETDSETTDCDTDSTDSETTDCDTDNGDSDSDNNIQTDTEKTDSETTDCDTDSTESETTDCDTDSTDSETTDCDTDSTDSETTDCDTDSTDSETTDCDTDSTDSDSDDNIQTDTDETDSETTDCDTDSTDSETTDCDTDSTDSETTDCDTDNGDSDSDDNIQTDTEETDSETTDCDTDSTESETTDCDTDSNSTDSYSDDNSQTDTNETDSESETNNSDKSEQTKTNPSNKITHNTQSVDAYYSPNIGAPENSAVTSPVPEKSAMKTGDKSSSVRFAAVWSMLIAALTVISLLFAKKRSKNEKGEAE